MEIMQGKRQQRGLTFLGLLVTAVVLALVGVLLAQAVPTYIEYTLVKKAVQKASTGSTVTEVRGLFDRAAQIDRIESVSGRDLEVVKQGERVVVSFAYQREIHLLGPAYLLLKYSGSSR
ncbi:DUF4845 domain-containing protein [Hydrogenophaga sp.]|uniref:DUF4845 domain-containing protein n=1 Tax=Hydrogenophaga sp. TaxID=1904254 RepID=UPI00344C6B6A